MVYSSYGYYTRLYLCATKIDLAPSLANNRLNWSEKPCNIYSMAKEEFGRNYGFSLDFGHPNDVEKTRGFKVTFGKIKPFNSDYRTAPPDKQKQVFHTFTKVAFNENDKILGLLEETHDIVKHKQGKEKLKKLYEAPLERLDEFKRYKVTNDNIDSVTGVTKYEFYYEGWREINVPSEKLESCQNMLQYNKNRIWQNGKLYY